MREVKSEIKFSCDLMENEINKNVLNIVEGKTDFN